VPYDDPSLDIVSADLATSRTALAAVIRLAGLDSVDPASPLGHAYLFEFDAQVLVRILHRSSQGYVFSAYGVTPLPRLFLSYVQPAHAPGWAEWGVYTGGASPYYLIFGSAHGVFDAARSEIRMWLPLGSKGALPSSLGTAMAVFGNLRATSYRYLGDPAPVAVPTGAVGPYLNVVTGLVLSGLPTPQWGSDSVDSDAIYVGGTRSCALVGR